MSPKNGTHRQVKDRLERRDKSPQNIFGYAAKKVYEAHHSLIESMMSITVESIKDILTGVSSKPKPADGEKLLFTIRQKTDSQSRILLLPAASNILKKYENHIQCEANETILPVISNQKTNAYLKEIAAVCGIDRNISFHIARHTFATTVTLSNGVPIESVSKMPGHTISKPHRFTLK